MNPRKILILFALVPVCFAFAQFNPEKTALNKIKKGEWAAALKILNKSLGKSLGKDSRNTEAHYVYALLFFTPKYFQFNIDSAHSRLRRAAQLYAQLEERDHARLQRFPIDSTILNELRIQIELEAFEKSKLENTESAYNHFIEYYPKAPQQYAAIELRDEAAFVVALKQNAHQAFQNFIDHYPTSHRAKEAKQRFEKLLFEHSTKSNRLADYKAFVATNPTSAFVGQAMQVIFELETVDGSETGFERFIREYPTGAYSKQAVKILFHLRIALLKPNELNDSLKSIYPLRDWLPITENGKWGFMDEAGREALAPALSGVNEKYFCGPLTADFIHAQKGIVGRNGSLIWVGNFTAVSDLGSGFLLAKTDSVSFVVHKGGWKLALPQFQEAEIIGSRFLILKNSTGWGLFALNGKPLLPFGFDKILARANFAILSKSKKEILVGLDDMIAYSNGGHQPVVADEIKSFGEKHFWVRNGSMEKLLDETLKEIIPFDRHSISFGPVGFIIKKNGHLTIQGWPSLESVPLASVQIVEPWLITKKTNENQSLFHIPSQKQIALNIDSIWFDSGFVSVLKGDSVKLWLSPSKSFALPPEENYSIRKAKDSSIFILTTSKTKTTVHRANPFVKLFSTTFNEIEPVLKNIFMITVKGKKGLLNEVGQVILPPEYNAILFTNGVFSLLKDKKFGSYDPRTKKLLKPIFDSNLQSYSAGWLIARMENKYVFLKTNGANQSNFAHQPKEQEFNEIEFWSDTVALVKRGEKYFLYSIPRKKNTLENINEFQSIENDGHERVAIFKQGTRYGLVGNASGIILKSEFEEISGQKVNRELIIIALKPAENGNMELIHFQLSGKHIRKQVMDRKAAYSVLCDE